MTKISTSFYLRENIGMKNEISECKRKKTEKKVNKAKEIKVVEVYK
jgi:hypothetical protein